MKLIFDIFLYTFEMIIAFVFISYNYDKKQSKTINTLFIGFFIFLTGALILKFVNNEILNLVVFFILNLLFFIICFKIKTKEAIIYSILLDAVMFGAEMIALFFSSYVMKFPTNAYKTNPATFYILTIISKIIYFAVTQFIAFIINKLKFKSNNSTRFIPLFIFPFISIAISVLFLRMSFVNNYDNRYNISFIILNIIMIIACIYVFIYYQRLAKSDAYLNELQTENKLLEINNDYIEVLKHQNNEMRMLFHDTKNHFLTIANIEEVNRYIALPMTATWFTETKKKVTTNREQITAELIYYWMISFNIPMECQKWHLNRLLTLIRVFNEKNQPKKKMSQQELYRQHAAINAANRKRFHSKG